jgi:hypothetical protein
MCSGASFTFGSGVADGETFCARLDLLLPGVRTINVAQRGFGLDQTYLWYKRERARYPHVLQIFAVNGTDFERTAQANLNGYPKPTLVIKDGALVAQNVPVPEWKGWSRWTDAGPAFAGLRLPQLIAGRREKSEATEQKRIDDQLWPAVEGIFRELVQMNKESGSAIVLVYLPIADEYLPGVRDVRRARLQKSMQKLGVPFVDLTNDLRKIERDSLPWMFITPNTIPVAGITGHYTASGHQWIANTLVEHFKNLSTVQAVLAGTVR